jgi:transposase
MLCAMQAPLFVRPLTDTEHAALIAGLQSSAAFTLRRCQILLASARREHVPAIARALGCNTQTVRNAIHAFNRSGSDALIEGSSRPHRIAAAFDPVAAERLRALLHRSPRAFDKPTSVWTLDLAAEVSFAQGLTHEHITGETIRVTLKRLGVRWQRAKQWITSPDPAYARKKGDATA